MHIRILKVVLHNFMSFGDAELNIEDDGFIQVSGRNENPADMATSNGSGKSSLWESVVWCLTGDTIRGTKQVSNLYGEDGTFVQLDFAIDNKTYSIIRSKDHKVYKSSLQIFIDGKDCSGKGLRDSEKLLQEYLPDITASLLGSVIILGQGLPQKFTNNTPSGRKEVLEKLSKSDFMIEDLKKRISSRKEVLNSSIRGFEDNVLSLNTRKQTINTTIQNNISQINSLDKTLLESELKTLLDEKTSLTDELSELKDSIDTLTVDVSEIVQQLSQVKVELNNATIQIDNQTRDQISKLQLSVNTNVTSLRHVESEIQKISNIRDICPTCGQHIPGVVKPSTDSLKLEAAKLEKLISEDNTMLRQLDYETNTKKSKITNEYNERINSIQAQQLELNSKLQSKKLLYQSTEFKLQDISFKINTVNVKIAQIDGTKSTLLQQNANLVEELNLIDQDLLYNNSEKDLQHRHLEIVSKFDTAVKRDFRGYLLSHIITYIEQRSKMYSKIIFETENVEFYLDGNNIHIAYMGKEYENLSGGEKQKIDLIVQFSIRDMLTNHLNFTSNILVLDEVFDGLDMIGCQKVLDVISSFNDIKNVFIVTHRKDLSIPCDRELVVVKSANQISEIK